MCEPVPLLESGHSVIERVILATYPALVVRSSGPPNNEMQRTAPGRAGAPPLISVLAGQEKSPPAACEHDLQVFAGQRVTIEVRLDSIERKRTRLMDFVSGMDATLAAARPRPEKWSVQEIVEQQVVPPDAAARRG